jgi:hypothetical protein
MQIERSSGGFQKTGSRVRACLQLDQNLEDDFIVAPRTIAA